LASYLPMADYQRVSSAKSGPVPDRRVFRQIHRYAGSEVDASQWPATVPAVAQILAEGLDLGTGVTVLAPPARAVP
jgi:hypothetical protein